MNILANFRLPTAQESNSPESYSNAAVQEYHAAMERRRRERSPDDEGILGDIFQAIETREIKFFDHCKRWLDILMAAVGLIVLAPLLICIAIAIKSTSRGAVLYVQKRVGRGGKTFPMLKFRTMIEGAEKLQSSLAASNELSGPVFKIKADTRITPVGKFLRKHSLDELPQLYNVLLGEMSVVGPRPPVPEEVRQYRKWQAKRLGVVPGLTCIWQTSGKNLVGFEEWMRMDINYVQNPSLISDLALIAKTFSVVLMGHGSY